MMDIKELSYIDLPSYTTVISYSGNYISGELHDENGKWRATIITTSLNETIEYCDLIINKLKKS